MKAFRFNSVFCILFVMIAATDAMAQTQSPIIQSVQIDQWFSTRFWIFAVIGVLLGAFEAGVLLRKQLPFPHRDDNRRARKHVLLFLLLAAIFMFAVLVIDITMIHQFGARTYGFWETFTQVFQNPQPWICLVIGIVTCLATITLWTRFSARAYRYAFIPK